VRSAFEAVRNRGVRVIRTSAMPTSRAWRRSLQPPRPRRSAHPSCRSGRTPHAREVDPLVLVEVDGRRARTGDRLPVLRRLVIRSCGHRGANGRRGAVARLVPRNARGGSRWIACGASWGGRARGRGNNSHSSPCLGGLTNQTQQAAAHSAGVSPGTRPMAGASGGSRTARMRAGEGTRTPTNRLQGDTSVPPKTPDMPAKARVLWVLWGLSNVGFRLI
jgi:hypothetical protein